MNTLKLANLALRFLLELCLLAAFGAWGFSLAAPLIIRIAMGILLPVLVAVVWGVFLSPRRSVQLPPAARLILELALFALAVAALAVAGRPTLAAALGVVYALNKALLMIFPSEAVAR